MILVDDAGGEWPMIGHAPWNGCNLADFVMPFFLFIGGMPIALAFKCTYPEVFHHAANTKPHDSHKKGDPLNSQTPILGPLVTRWCGILQRIALAYFVVALIEISTKTAQAKDLLPVRFSIFKLYCWHWLVGACVIVYLALICGVYVPDWHFTVDNIDSADYGKIFTVNCGVRGKLDPPCNTEDYIDREVFGINHMYAHPAWKRSKACTKNSPYEGPFRNDAPTWCLAPFEPEGILSSISAILSTIIGVHYGHVLIHMQVQSFFFKLRHWVVMGLVLLVLGITLHFTDAIPLNKQLYTFSYVWVTSGAAALMFSAFYVLRALWNMEEQRLTALESSGGARI
ncbi:hypothetical protein RHMOL_Rhmol05G0191700 [Rhododendron molle]|uniref:Uncharacterized protein n=1 Tax=Rhododendron molle TaxID=49168 RepID=A0ACC0NQZ7_RHOML|nr:hypothetical protein RHMOL_Rhmol05G0191700 [Rhododendron molle]